MNNNYITPKAVNSRKNRINACLCKLNKHVYDIYLLNYVYTISFKAVKGENLLEILKLKVINTVSR